MAGYIINTDPHWLAFLFGKGIRSPVFWLKRRNNPNKSAIVIGNPIFFRITQSDPPVIKGYGTIAQANGCALSDAFLRYGERLGYSAMDVMMATAAEWTGDVDLRPNSEIFCIEISDFQVTEDIRTDIDLMNLGIKFDHRHVVTGKQIDNAQSDCLVRLAQSRRIMQVSSLISFLKNGPADYQADEFNPKDIQDARERIARLIVKRRGQPEFRRKLLAAYNSKCAITGCDAEEALEAAHIVPYQGPETNHISNGLLLRADVHTLFDLGLLTVDSATMTVLIHKDLIPTEYGCWMGKSLNLPTDKRNWPSRGAIDTHHRDSGM